MTELQKRWRAEAIQNSKFINLQQQQQNSQYKGHQFLHLITKTIKEDFNNMSLSNTVNKLYNVEI